MMFAAQAYWEPNTAAAACRIEPEPEPSGRPARSVAVGAFSPAARVSPCLIRAAVTTAAAGAAGEVLPAGVPGTCNSVPA
jgi:hypothetical protein